MSKRTNRRLTVGSTVAIALAALTLSAGASAQTVAPAQSAFGPTRGTVDRISAPDSKAREADGVYGRFNGDFSFAIGAGLEADLKREPLRPLVLGDFTVYQTLGLYSSFRQGVEDDDEVKQALSLGLEVSPLFLWRWSRAWEKGPAFWDLTLDSLTLSGGLALRRDDKGGLFQTPRSEFGLGFGLPLMGQANGLWLRTRVQATPGHEWEPSAFLWLSWQGFVHAGLL